MAWNRCTVFDMDAHSCERVGKFFKDCFDPTYRAPFDRLCEAMRRTPREVIAGRRYFHGIDSCERSLELCVEELGEEMWLFASDWPHGDTAWPKAVPQAVGRQRVTERARRKILGENVMRFCPRLRP